ncbi:H(+)-transporting V0 sector ATPase subunit e [Orbilia ellipsospora]|uniref:H(+)-transporting V0 sector ATPase subunit e n=1 Tax=Orbilia ellipsospora TaxID=2528407 RepID=A0AAV9WYQ2_9PEZI
MQLPCVGLRLTRSRDGASGHSLHARPPSRGPLPKYIITITTYSNSYEDNNHPFTLRTPHTYYNMANGYSVIVGLAICIVVATAGYFLAPKGENLTVWRSSILLTVACTYIMWALTLLAQLNPLVQPYAGDFRKEYIE